jgi:hypothetical protein
MDIGIMIKRETEDGTLSKMKKKIRRRKETLITLATKAILPHPSLLNCRKHMQCSAFPSTLLHPKSTLANETFYV